ncbi:MAG: methylated-DNA-[protein]-cysteine S-methyltransferase [Planctomycetota bacterium]|jgi:methylated-DNA-[protein]-cysteine S-methyltransferase
MAGYANRLLVDVSTVTCEASSWQQYMSDSNNKPSSKKLAKLVIPSPLGPLLAFASERGIRAIVFSDSDPSRNGVRGDIVSASPGMSETETLVALAEQLAEYFGGKRTLFKVPLDPVGTDFQLLAWEELRKIPFGKTRTYAEQAAAIGNASAVRAVGTANGRNPLTIVVPCHRVIGADGTLTGFAGGIDRKRALLKLEGVKVDEAELPFAKG